MAQAYALESAAGDSARIVIPGVAVVDFTFDRGAVTLTVLALATERCEHGLVDACRLRITNSTMGAHTREIGAPLLKQNGTRWYGSYEYEVGVGPAKSAPYRTRTCGNAPAPGGATVVRDDVTGRVENTRRICNV